MDPFHQSGLDADEAWGTELFVNCACGQKTPLWQKKCTRCKVDLRFHRLLKKRQRLERWLDRKSAADIVPALQAADLLPEPIQKFERMLAEVVRRPLPDRQKKEQLAAYLKRVLTFFPPMFKTTSPAGQAREIDDRLKRSALAMNKAADQAIHKVLSQAMGPTILKRPVASVEKTRVAHLRKDLTEPVTPYLEALKIMLMYHNRMVSAWAQVRPILSRPLPEGKVKGAWNKVRSMVNPVGQLLNFGTAIWSEPEEKEHLQRFEKEITRFLEQTQRFQEQTSDVEEKRKSQNQAWVLSFRRAMLSQISQNLADCAPDRRKIAVDHILAQKGVGAWWWRLFFAKKALAQK